MGITGNFSFNDAEHKIILFISQNHTLNVRTHPSSEARQNDYIDSYFGISSFLKT